MPICWTINMSRECYPFSFFFFGKFTCDCLFILLSRVYCHWLLFFFYSMYLIMDKWTLNVWRSLFIMSGSIGLCWIWVVERRYSLFNLLLCRIFSSFNYMLSFCKCVSVHLIKHLGPIVKKKQRFMRFFFSKDVPNCLL